MPIWQPKSDFFSQFVFYPILTPYIDELSHKKNENLPHKKKISPPIQAYNMNNYRFLADNQVCI